MKKQYSVIYADPPWRYRCTVGQGIAEDHYPTMPIAEIKSLPINNLAAPDCALFLWITCPMLCEAWSLMEAWGFQFKTVAFVWVKVNRREDSLFTGLGWWTRSNAELCLLATRGRPKRYSKSVHQIIIARVGEHSKKPDITRRRIEMLMGDVPRVGQ